MIALTSLGGAALAESTPSASPSETSAVEQSQDAAATSDSDGTAASSAPAVSSGGDGSTGSDESSKSDAANPSASKSSDGSAAEQTEGAGSVQESSGVDSSVSSAPTATVEGDSASEVDQESVASQVADIAALVAGPDAGIEAPYLYWEARSNASGNPLVGGATFNLQSRSGSNWSNTINVTDNTGQSGYSGLDLDPDPGEFVVKYLNASQTTQVTYESRYQVRMNSGPAGYTPANSSWGSIGSGSSNWNNGQGAQTHDFGDFIFNRSFATILVQVGGDRSGLTNVLGLQGVTLQLWNGNGNGPTSQRSESWATCVSDATGLCTFEVPIAGTGGAGTSFQPWVVQPVNGVPSGWFTNTQLRTGTGTGGSNEETNYRFRLGSSLAANTTYRSTVTGSNGFMLSSTSGTRTTRDASGGIWQQSRNNPTLPAQCGLDMALVLDLSGSVTTTDLANLKSAATTITNSLVGTQSRAALFSFSTGSPADNATVNSPSLTSVSTVQQANAFTARWADWTSGGATNWDRALATVAQASAGYDVVVVITDGNPTFYQAAEGPGDYTRLREMENAVFSANAIKAEGSRVLAVGVGSGVTDTETALNLKAISGPTKYSSAGSGNATTADYFQESSYSAAANAIRAMALGNCASSVSVTKMIVPSTNEGENINGAVTAPEGWEFTASATSPATISEPVKTTTSDGTGVVNFPVTLTGSQESASVTIAETQQSGYELVTQNNGERAVCTRQDGGAVTVTNDSSSDYGFTVDVPATTGVSCTVYNRAPDERASITLEKYWKINGADAIPNGQQPADFVANPLLSGPGAGADEPGEWSWNVERSGYTVGEVVTVGETMGTQVDETMLCEIVSAKITKVNDTAVDIDLLDGDSNGSRTGSLPSGTLPAGHSTVEITNEVTCTSQLILRKRVADRNTPAGAGQVDPSLWTLTAIAPDGALTGPTGQSSSLSLTNAGKDPTGEVTPNVVYQLAESGGDPRYVQHDERAQDDDGNYLNPDSTGSMTCERINPKTGEVISGYSDGIQGGVTVPLGYLVRCTANNETASLTLLKHVEGDASFTADDWDLTATPASGFDGLTTTTVTGAESVEGTASTFRVRPGHTYSLSEALGAGESFAYLQLGLQKLDPATNEWVDVDSANVTLGLSESATYRFVNMEPASPALPLTGGLGTDTFLLAGGGLLALAGLGGWIHRRRSQRLRLA